VFPVAVRYSEASSLEALQRNAFFPRCTHPVINRIPAREKKVESETRFFHYSREMTSHPSLRLTDNVRSFRRAILAIAGIFALGAHTLPAQAPKTGDTKKVRTVRIVVAGDPSRAIEAPRKGLATSSKTGTGFRLVPGLANPEMVSFESTRAKGTYLHHRVWKIEVNERPKDILLQKDFDWEATFKIVKVKDDEVLLEAGNRPGEYIVVEPEGRYALAKAKNEPLRMQFKLVDK
jgi:hypothetical protein